MDDTARRKKAFKKLKTNLVPTAYHRLRPLLSRNRLSTRQFVTISNMWHERAEAVIEYMTNGDCYSPAYDKTQGIYDTCHWGEVSNRSARARGSIFCTMAQLARQGNQILREPRDANEVIRLARRLLDGSRSLGKSMAEFALSAAPVKLKAPKEKDFDANKPATFKTLVGRLRAADAFIAKNNRDRPHIVDKTDKLPEPKHLARIDRELKLIALGAELLVQMCRHRLFGFLPDRRATVDELGVDRRYYVWLKPVFAKVKSMAASGRRRSA